MEELRDLDFLEILEIIRDYHSQLDVSDLINNLDWNNIRTVDDLKAELEENFEEE